MKRILTAAGMALILASSPVMAAKSVPDAAHAAYVQKRDALKVTQKDQREKLKVAQKAERDKLKAAQKAERDKLKADIKK